MNLTKRGEKHNCEMKATDRRRRDVNRDDYDPRRDPRNWIVVSRNPLEFAYKGDVQIDKNGYT